jgi:D-glycero-alpha-D-manno-heptose 1-phosphate guanylyltransferase
MIRSAVILAGGFGTRLQTVVSRIPKPMAPVNGIPFLDYQLNYLQQSGITDVHLSVGYLAHVITDHYRNRYRDINIKYALEEIPLGTGGGIRKALKEINDKEAVILNGDSFFDVDLNDLYSKHCSSVADVSIALRMVEDASRYGEIQLSKDNRIISFREKVNKTGKVRINGGTYILNKKVFMDNTPSDKPFSIERDFFASKLDSIKIMGFEFDGYFIDIGIPEDYMRAQNDFKEFKYR